MGKDSGHGSIQHVYEGYGFDSGVEPLLQQPVVPTNTIDVDAEGVPVKKGGMTLNGGVANLTNTILGVGTMAMPLALKLCGITLYTVLMLGVCLAAMKAVGVLFESVEMLNVSGVVTWIVCTIYHCVFNSDAGKVGVVSSGLIVHVFM